MRESSTVSPNPAFRASDPSSVGYKAFLQVGKIGKCSLARLVMSAVLSNAGAGLMAALLFSVRRIIELDSGLLDSRFVLIVFQISGLLIFSEILFFVSESIDINHGIRVLEALRLRIFSHIVHLPLPLIQKKPVGEWVARCDHDVRLTQQGVFSLPRILIAFPITFLVYMGSIFKLSPSFAGVVFIGAIMGVLPAFLLRRRLLSISATMMQQIGDLAGRIGETFLHIKTIKAFCGESASIQSINDWSKKYISLAWKARLLSITARQVSTFIMTCCFITVALIGRSMIKNGTQTLGELVPILVGVVLIARELRKVSGILGEIQNYRSAIRRYLDSLSLTIENLEPRHPLPLSRPISHFSFENITFSYDDQEACLKDIDFHVKRGETLSIVGLSGVGKSTLIELILGFVKPQKGSIRVDGKLLDTYSLKHWRECIGAVFQPPALFSGTLKENLLKFSHAIDHEELWRHLRAVGLEQTVRKRNGLDLADINENATNWSEGEAQRLVLLRALFLNPDILLLDEATSALDAKSEASVVDLIKKGMSSRITLIITHRMSLAINADTILVLGQDGVEGIGTPEKLYVECPLFRYMCMAQRIVPPGISP